MTVGYVTSIMDHLSKSRPNEFSPVDRLSERQKQCLELVAAGHTSKQIGKLLNLSPSTVDNHVNAATERLGVDSRAMAARIFINRNQLSGFSDTDARQHFSHFSDNRSAYRHRAPTPINDRQTIRSFFRLPPVGGVKNQFTISRRYFHVIQIMILSLMVFSAVIVTIAGIVHLFSQ
jgi:DNA-binding CsgD family transcriptional regulator